ncbi:MAG: winged helix-turn-helix domain-containing protein, partial [Chloroflexi bacterium]|nr:winged helix-turn-helix domain-containing protein [Chloroflexota bacterium]
MLTTLFSSRVRSKLLTAFFLSPGVEWTAWRLAQSQNESYSAVWKELNKLEKISILTSKRQGNSKTYRVNPQCPIAPELSSILPQKRS